MDAAHRACLAPAAVDAWAAPGAVRLDVLAKCREEVHDSPSAEGLDFQKAAAALWVEEVRQDAQEPFPALQPQVAPRKVAYSREPQPLAEPVRLRVAKLGLQGEWVSAKLAEQASRQLERLRVLAQAFLEQSLVQQA